MLEISLAIIKLTAIAVLGYYFYKKDFIDQKVLNFLIFFVVNLAIPFLAFSHLLENLKVGMQPSPVIFVFSAFVVFIVSVVLSFIFSFKRSHEFKKEFISVVSFQNCGYLPLSIAFSLFPANLREEFIIYTFLYILGFDIIMWSIGTFFIFKKKGEAFKLRSLFTPPIVSTLCALFLVYTNTAKFVPGIIVGPIKMIGDTSFVLSMIILGCWLAKINTQNFYKKLYIILEASFLKLIVLPLIFLLILIKLDISSLFGFFIILQASMPSAVTLPIVVNLRQADSEFVSQGVLFTHVLGIATIPLWIGLYLKFLHFSF